MKFRSTIAILLLAAAGGCVEYRPVELGVVQPPEEVRVRLSNEGAVTLARTLGRLTDEVSASAEPAGPDSVALTIWLGKDYPGSEFANVRETAVLPRDQVLALETRELSTWRTAAASAGALAVALYLADQILQIGSPNSGDDPGGEQPPPSLYRFSIPWGGIF